MPKPQTAQSHAAMDPAFHYVLLPILLLNLIFSIGVTIHEWPNHPHTHPWWIVMSVALILLAMKTRMYALADQDRIIRLEERLRLAALLPASELPATQALTTRQLIALRFASDAELPALARRALSENLSAPQIKQAITSWRPDDQRI